MNIKQALLDCQNKILKENNLDLDSNLDMEMSVKNGIDSMGIVELVLALEEALDIELDNVLADIRKCKTMKELLSILEEQYKLQHEE